MKKSFQITALTTLMTFLLMGTAIAHPLSDGIMPWYESAGEKISLATSPIDKQSGLSFEGIHPSQGSDLWQYARRFTRIQQIVEFAGYRANLTVTVQSMLLSVRDVGLAPTITLEFVW